MQRDLEKVEEFYAAHRKRNWAGMLLLLAKEVVILQSDELPWGGHFQGHEAARQYFVVKPPFLLPLCPDTSWL